MFGRVIDKRKPGLQRRPWLDTIKSDTGQNNNNLKTTTKGSGRGVTLKGPDNANQVPFGLWRPQWF